MMLPVIIPAMPIAAATMFGSMNGFVFWAGVWSCVVWLDVSGRFCAWMRAGVAAWLAIRLIDTIFFI